MQNPFQGASLLQPRTAGTRAEMTGPRAQIQEVTRVKLEAGPEAEMAEATAQTQEVTRVETIAATMAATMIVMGMRAVTRTANRLPVAMMAVRCLGKMTIERDGMDTGCTAQHVPYDIAPPNPR